MVDEKDTKKQFTYNEMFDYYMSSGYCELYSFKTFVELCKEQGYKID